MNKAMQTNEATAPEDLGEFFMFDKMSVRMRWVELGLVGFYIYRTREREGVWIGLVWLFDRLDVKEKRMNGTANWDWFRRPKLR